MLKKIVVTFASAMLITAGAHAQSQTIASVAPAVVIDQATGVPMVPTTLPPPPAQGQQAQPRPAEPAGQPVNISIELTIAETGSAGPAKKIVSMIVADRDTGSVRSKGTVKISSNQAREISINVDARPTITKEGGVRLALGLEYQPKVAGDPGGTSQPAVLTAPATEPASSNLNQRITVMLESGKPLVISQAADPGSDRQITVTVKATILK